MAGRLRVGLLTVLRWPAAQHVQSCVSNCSLPTREGGGFHVATDICTQKKGACCQNAWHDTCYPSLWALAVHCPAPCVCDSLALKPGELPTALELDERSHPALTDDLLHLVHGRTLLGVVQLPATLQLTGVWRQTG